MTRQLEHRELVIASNHYGFLFEVQSPTAGAIDRVHRLVDKRGKAPEDLGKTLQEAAIARAVTAARSTGLPAIAEAKGLEVEALGGYPGVRMLDINRPNKNDDNNAHILQSLLDAGASILPDRGAQLVSNIAIAWPDGEVVHERAAIDGVISIIPQGTISAGFDPIFRPFGLLTTLAQMQPEERSQFRPTARALDQLVNRVMPGIASDAEADRVAKPDAAPSPRRPRR
ncbi:MAG: hypothetical protein KI792_14200 [Alphaproteobacteria bacterium]|nr:hypothetical protein [Alphaproteobacteria bacterium SS10]